METVMLRHCDGIKLLENVTLHNRDRFLNEIMKYSNNMITQKITSDVISDPNEWSRSSARSKKITMTK